MKLKYSIAVITSSLLIFRLASTPAEAVELLDIPASDPVEIEEVSEVTDLFYGLNCDEFELLCKCVEAESGNQDILGRRLVADVILNRVDSPRFPNDVTAVITQPSQFAVVTYGTIWNITPSEGTYQAVAMELQQRTDSEILFFTAGGYNYYCIPAYQHGAHFFGY